MPLRRAGPEDTAGICRLLGEVNPGNPKADPRVVDWQYWSNPYGDAISVVWEEDGAIVSHVATVPVPLILDGRRVPGGLTVDAATSEPYRGRGIYSKVRQASFPAWQERVEVRMDFRAATTRLPPGSAPRVDSYRRHVMPLDKHWLAGQMRIPPAIAAPMVRLGRPGRDTRGEEVGAAPDDVDELWRQAEPNVRYGIRKEGTWWSWRYGARPSSGYRYFVLREGGRLGAAAVILERSGPGGKYLALLDLLASSRERAKEIVGTIAREASGAGAIVFLSPSGSYWSRVARGAGFHALPRWADRKPPVLNARDLRGKYPNLSEACWDSTWGDMDHL